MSEVADMPPAATSTDPAAEPLRASPDSTQTQGDHVIPTTIIRPTKLAHIVLRTPKFAESLAWWTTVLGAEVTFQNKSAVFLTYDDEHHRIAIFDAPHVGEQDSTRAGLEHVAFTYEDLDALLATYERLRTVGITPFAPIHHGITLSMYYVDPDNNQIELQVDTMPPTQAADFMTSDTFEANPGGVVFDPDEFIARRDAGESVESLMAYTTD